MKMIVWSWFFLVCIQSFNFVVFSGALRDVTKHLMGHLVKHTPGSAPVIWGEGVWLPFGPSPPSLFFTSSHGPTPSCLYSHLLTSYPLPPSSTSPPTPSYLCSHLLLLHPCLFPPPSSLNLSLTFPFFLSCFLFLLLSLFTPFVSSSIFIPSFIHNQFFLPFIFHPFFILFTHTHFIFHSFLLTSLASCLSLSQTHTHFPFPSPPLS